MSQSLALHNSHLPELHLLTLRLSNQILQKLHRLFKMTQCLGLKSLNFEQLTFCCLGSGLRSLFSLLQTFLLIELCALMLGCDWFRERACLAFSFYFLFFIFEFCIHQSLQKNIILTWCHFFFQFLSLNCAFLFIFWDFSILSLFSFQIPFPD